jgi:predicted Rossmann fold nucleotide-binding protein DprA/Smf involved in DNA uptake
LTNNHINKADLFLTHLMSLTPHQKSLLYSLEDTLTLGQLKRGDFPDPQITLNAPAASQLNQRMETHHITAITPEIPEYPEKFSQSKRTPYLVYALGNLSLLQQKTLGIV